VRMMSNYPMREIVWAGVLCWVGFLLPSNALGQDCNNNGVPDVQDVDPTDPDGDGEVLPDCDGNGVPDACDLATCSPGNLYCADCNNNGVPDGCEFSPTDCDLSMVSDFCELPILVETFPTDNEMIDPSDDAYAVSFAVEGNVLVVGAPNDSQEALGSGAIYVYERQAMTWEPVATLRAPNPVTGMALGGYNSLALQDGIIYAGCRLNEPVTRGAVFRFSKSGDIWGYLDHFELPEIETDDVSYTHITVSGATMLAADGSDVNSVVNAGRVHVYRFLEGSWNYDATITDQNLSPYSNFGFFTWLHGDTAVIDTFGNNNQSRYQVFRDGPTGWARVGNLGLIINDNANATSGIADVDFDGEFMVVGEVGNGPFYPNPPLINAGIVHILRNVGGEWMPVTRVLAPDFGRDRYFGRNVSINGDDLFATAVGWSIYHFKNFDGQWRVVDKLLPEEPFSSSASRLEITAGGGYVFGDTRYMSFNPGPPPSLQAIKYGDANLHDCDGNGIVDSCDPDAADCDGNGVIDICESFEDDCNFNGTADSCEITLQTIPNFVFSILNNPNLNNYVSCRYDTDHNGIVDGSDIELFVQYLLD